LAATTAFQFLRIQKHEQKNQKELKESGKNLKNSLPSGIELVGEYIHAWGTEYTI
jgi:hypothetical protein